mmetsp:Transcript_20312/g.36919  ORF Transcript_20312/g.36919 Transcript_20312/m.36919 type:complete len:228 (+) Transcript_20312:1260-1943(+)
MAKSFQRVPCASSVAALSVELYLDSNENCVEQDHHHHDGLKHLMPHQFLAPCGLWLMLWWLNKLMHALCRPASKVCKPSREARLQLWLVALYKPVLCSIWVLLLFIFFHDSLVTHGRPFQLSITDRWSLQLMHCLRLHALWIVEVHPRSASNLFQAFHDRVHLLVQLVHPLVDFLMHQERLLPHLLFCKSPWSSSMRSRWHHTVNRIMASYLGCCHLLVHVLPKHRC